MRLLRLMSFIAIAVCAHAQSFSSGSTGADGDFIPPASMPAGSTAPGTGCVQPPFSCTVTVPLREPPNNIYNFANISIPAGITVKFLPNRANTPVILLGNANATIAGAIDISGALGSSSLLSAAPAAPGQGGPGGFNGGASPVLGAPDQTDLAAGLGPGAGGLTTDPEGTFSDGDPSLVYGTPQLQPLIGGSGAAGRLISASGQQLGGDGGGGAILIAVSGSLNLGAASGTTFPCAILANGAGRGSGGAIRLVATNLTGVACLSAIGNAVPIPGVGRIRLESAQPSQYTGTTNPAASISNPLFDPPITLFPAITPTLQIVSIAGQPLPPSPTANANTPDLVLPGNAVNVTVEATHVPAGTAVQVLVAPQFGAGPSQIVLGQLIGATGQIKTATVSVTLPPTGAGNISAVIRTPFVPEP